jgi:hypothetical protein
MTPPNYVAAYVKRNKTDGRDAVAICGGGAGGPLAPAFGGWRP